MLFKQPIKANIGAEKYKVSVTWAHGDFIADEPEKLGGQNAGPDPYTLLLSALASCTLATLKMYIDKQQWNIEKIYVAINMEQRYAADVKTTTIFREIFLIQQ